MTGLSLEQAMEAHRAGRLTEAEFAYGRLLDDDPNHADASHLLGLVHHQRGRNDLAVGFIETAIGLNPNIGNYHNSLGLALRALQRLDVAEAALRTAVSLDPNDADAHNNLGLVLTDLRRFVEAEDALRRSLGLRPGNPGTLNNLGRALVALARPLEAITVLQSACRGDTEHADYVNSLGVALREAGRYAEAQGAFEQALSMNPENADAHLSHAQLLLMNGDFENGWPEHEWRLRRAEHRHRPAARWWMGAEPVDGKTVLLWAEQGFGDAIQFVRFAAKVADRGAVVVVECAPELHRLFSSVRGVSRVVAPGDAVSFDYHCALMSLPGILNCVPNGDFPAYIAAPTPMALDADPGPKIGLVWAGNPRHANDLNRSRALTEFSPLVRPNLSFYGVQKGPAAHQAPPPSMQFRELEDDLHDFQDTARALMALDLLITVDTATAHLAGALGRPVWVLLPLVADWRWLRDRDDSPWYPSMRLFRQEAGEEWASVMDRVAATLFENVKADSLR
jgi:tetratricopeptide (TPR) repeat protein